MGQTGSINKKEDFYNGPDYARKRIVDPTHELRKALLERLPRKIAIVNVPSYRIEREGLATQHVAVRYPVYGHPGNHLPFLNPDILERLVPFIMSRSLPKMMSVCPHWFLTLHDYLVFKWTHNIWSEFERIYENRISFEKLTLAFQPLYTDTPGIRVDLLLYAKVRKTDKLQIRP